MAYVPPNKRTPKAFVNTSQKRCVAPPKTEFVNITSNESFPILGNISSKYGISIDIFIDLMH